MVRAIGEKKNNLSQSVLNILQTISTYENIPRKKAKFLNFMKNSFRYMKQDDLESAWTLLEEAMKENKAQQQPQVQQQNGNKRKLEEESNGDHENGNDTKKTKTEEVNEEAKFNWGETIKTILLKKNKEIGMGKLKKKVMIEKKFNKKLNKLQGVVLDNEKVRLIE
jgi:cell growth-regulating nucleolar protein